jgi:hypothetical protein
MNLLSAKEFTKFATLKPSVIKTMLRKKNPTIATETAKFLGMALGEYFYYACTEEEYEYTVEVAYDRTTKTATANFVS